MKLLRFVVLALAAVTAQARDSTWLLCSNESLVVSSHEHRAGGDGRATSLTLIFGVHEMRGTLKDADSGKVMLKAGSETGTAFSGTVSLDYQANELTIAGVLKIDGEPNDMNATLQCKEMSAEL